MILRTIQFLVAWTIGLPYVIIAVVSCFTFDFIFWVAESKYHTPFYDTKDVFSSWLRWATFNKGCLFWK